MKIKYKHMIGSLTPEKYLGSCARCCFHSWRCCIPYGAYNCTGTIFEESESRVFEV